MKKNYIFILLILIISLSSCDDFFSDSWGDQRDFARPKIEVNADNVDDWVKVAMGNPELADVLGDLILLELFNQAQQENQSNQWDKAALLDGGTKVVVESSGLGMSILTHAADALTELEEESNAESMQDILRSVQDDFNSNGGIDAANKLADMAVTCIDDPHGVPRFENAYTQTVQPGNVSEAIMVLVLGELGDDPIDDNWNNVSDLSGDLAISTNKEVHVTGTNPSNISIALAAYLNMISDDTTGKFDKNPFTSALSDAFFGF